MPGGNSEKFAKLREILENYSEEQQQAMVDLEVDHGVICKEAAIALRATVLSLFEYANNDNSALDRAIDSYVEAIIAYRDTHFRQSLLAIESHSLQLKNVLLNGGTLKVDEWATLMEHERRTREHETALASERSATDWITFYRKANSELSAHARFAEDMCVRCQVRKADPLTELRGGVR